MTAISGTQAARGAGDQANSVTDRHSAVAQHVQRHGEEHGIVTDQVTMHHGQRVPRAKMLCPISQHTKAKAKAMPAQNASQNQRLKRAPARIAAPTTIGATQPANPRIGLGNPNTLPCHDWRLAVHCTRTLKSQDAGGVRVGEEVETLCREGNAAIQPTTPATMSQTARAIGRAGAWESDMFGL